MTKFGWCVIGAGGIADRRVIPAIMKDEGSRLVALMDKNADVAQRLGEKYGVPFFTSEEEMMKAADCDAVYIGTPVALHCNQALAAIEAGRHVLVEKPIAIRAADGERMLAAAKKAGKALTAGYMMEFHNLHARAKEIIESGQIGRVNSVSARFAGWYPPVPGAWRQTRALGGGGAMMDVGVHCIDIIEFILSDRIEKVKAFCHNRTFHYDAEDEAAAVFMTADGVIGNVNANFNVPDACESRLEFYGEGGSIVLSGTLGQEEKGTLSLVRAVQKDYSAMQTRESVEARVFTAEGGDMYQKQIAAFRLAAESGQIDYSGAARAVGVQKTIEKIYEQA